MGMEKEKSMYVKFDVPSELESKALETLELARTTGNVKKGTNETTKIVERGMAKLVLIAEDVNPEEIIMHLPPLCEEKNTPYLYVKSQKDVGAACGINVACSSAAIVDPGSGEEKIKEIVEELKKIKG